MKRYWWIGIIIAVAVFVRLVFNGCFPGYRTSGDTVTYYLTGWSILKTKTINDPWRTPVYPLIMTLPFVLAGKEMPPTMSQVVFTPEFLQLRILQSVAGIATLVMLFFLLVRLKVRDSIAGVFVLFMAGNWTLLVFEYYVLTETFTTLWLVSVVYLTVHLLERFRIGLFLVLFLLFIVGVFLRPMNICIPFIFWFVLLWHHPKRSVAVAVACSIMVYAGILLGYSQANYRTVGYRGISRIVDINILGNILAYRLSPSNDSDNNGVGLMVRDYMKYSQDPDPWQLMRQYPQLYNQSYAMGIRRFVLDTVRIHLWEYTVKTIKNIPAGMTTTPLANKNMEFTGVAGRILGISSVLYQYIQIVNLFLFIALPVLLVNAYRKKSVVSGGIVLITLVGVYHILTAFLLSYSDYIRLISPAQPMMMFVAFATLFRLLRRIT